MMKIKQTILVFTLLIGVGGFLFVPTVSADICNPGTSEQFETSVVPCSTGVDASGHAKTGVEGILQLVINILTAGVGVAAVGGIIYASILYASAADSSEQTKKSISVIIDVVIGLVAFALLRVFLNFIIPGGVPIW